MPDKFTATWVSHTSLSDFIQCPRAYFLKNVYKDPQTGHKIKIMSPALALGQVVHEVLESLSVLPLQRRFQEPLMERFEKVWEKVKGKKGGFRDIDSEYKHQQRGREMIRRVINHPGPIAELSVKIQADLPYVWLSEPDNIILCGKIDWLKYIPEQDAVHIIDFKTGKAKEDPESLQLSIYHLLVHYCQKRKVLKAAYWYLETDDELVEKELPPLKEAEMKVLELARRVKLARQLKKFDCHRGEDGCRNCLPFEAVLKKQAELVGVDEYNYDVYILNQQADSDELESVVL